MSPKFIIKSAFRALRKHKMRSLLTTLGIIVGIISIITVMSIGQGAKQKAKEHFKNVILYSPGIEFEKQSKEYLKNIGQNN